MMNYELIMKTIIIYMYMNITEHLKLLGRRTKLNIAERRPVH